MQAKFYIKTIFTINSRNYLVLGGNILQGKILKGMFFTLNNRRIEINGIEIIDYPDSSASTGLLIKYKDEQEKQNLEQLLQDIKEIDITN